MQDHQVLLAEYTLGLLDGQETAEAHALLGRDTEAVKTALNWENNLLELVDLLTPVRPSWQVLQRIQSDLGHQPTPAPSSLYRKPASNDDTPAVPIPEPAMRQAPHAPARQNPGTEPASAGGSPKRQAPVHAEPYFSALPDVATATALPGSEPARSDAYGDRQRHDAPAATNQGAASIPPAPSAADVATGLGTTPPAAEASLHIMGERDPRRTGHATPEKPVKEKKHKPADVGTTRKSVRSVTGNIWLWRGATLVFGLSALVLAILPSAPAKPPVTVVEVAPTQAAILQAPGQSSTPGWVVTIDAQQNVLLSPQVRTDIPSDAAVQLWTRSKTMPQPRSLGLIDPNQPVTVPAALMGELSPDQIFEMTQEPAGGSPTANPSGPVLFIGRLVTFGKPAAVESPGTDTSNAKGNHAPAGSR
ncbi:hypothetical protein G5B35_11525 [Parapusillimonas sp. SGNA-6]|nr:hypothetical protein [Parapusillimonas sp. SGNA-6]